MTKFFLIAASSVLAIASGPVAAREPAATAATAAPVEQFAAPRAQREQTYCVIETVTGSRIPHKTCRTRGDWLKEGFDPLNPDK